ncbi:MAG: pyridoxal-phosphate dependent enzyme, partial [Vicinamibacteria bacterium]
MTWMGVIAAYKAFLPIENPDRPVTLLEGNTPLVESVRLRSSLRDDVRLFFKCEGMNPTGSFKDRGMTVAVTNAVEKGAKAIVCASTGNTAASAAAYAARAGIRALVILPKGKIALGKFSQATFHGARVLQIEGNFDLALRLVL